MIKLQTWMHMHNMMHTTLGVREGIEVYVKEFNEFVSKHGQPNHHTRMKVFNDGDVNAFVELYDDLKQLQIHEMELLQLCQLQHLRDLRNFIKVYSLYKQEPDANWYVGKHKEKINDTIKRLEDNFGFNY